MQNPENLTPPTVPEMLRVTGANTATFMQQIAEHIEALEEQVVKLAERLSKYESVQNESE